MLKAGYSSLLNGMMQVDGAFANEWVVDMAKRRSKERRILVLLFSVILSMKTGEAYVNFGMTIDR